jgi:hypothetical protein
MLHGFSQVIAWLKSGEIFQAAAPFLSLLSKA